MSFLKALSLPLASSEAAMGACPWGLKKPYCLTEKVCEALSRVLEILLHIILNISEVLINGLTATP